MNIREAITKPIPTANTRFQIVERIKTTSSIRTSSRGIAGIALSPL